ncbi:MAG: hypothetical protein KIT31_05260 [Deltaproteobacteria bacterium]|nr:hypothetical protein [Deltaproteobacteria bacterium]
MPQAGDGIDYGPARTALRALATWALDLAERDLAGDPDGLRHVRNARRVVFAKLGDKPAPRGGSLADLQFAAFQIAHLLDRDLQLGIGEHLDLIETLEEQASCRFGELAFGPRRKRENTDVSGVPITRLPAGPVPTGRPTVGFSPPPLRFCEDCGLVHELADHIPLAYL